MPTLLPKLILTPLLIGGASLAQRRWGAQVSGWIIALPLTTGPVILFVALDQSGALAAAVAHGALAGVIAQTLFALGYARMCVRAGTAAALATGVAGFAIMAVLFPDLVPSVTYLVGLTAVGAVLWLLPDPIPDADRVPVQPPGWEVPARIAVATCLVLLLTTLAPIIGGRASGVIATFPVYASVLTTFAQRTRGPGEAIRVLRGLLYGLPGFATFCLTVGSLLTMTGVWMAFGLALAVTLAVQGTMLWVLMNRDGASAG